MGLGFIPQNDNHDADAVGMASERWRAEQAMEALVNMLIDACCEALLKQVRRYSEQLECLDPLKHNAEQAVGHVVLALSYDASAQERLDTLLSETGRLKLAVAEARSGRSKGAELPSRTRRLTITGLDVFLVLLWGFALIFVLIA